METDHGQQNASNPLCENALGAVRQPGLQPGGCRFVSVVSTTAAPLTPVVEVGKGAKFASGEHRVEDSASLPHIPLARSAGFEIADVGSNVLADRCRQVLGGPRFGGRKQPGPHSLTLPLQLGHESCITGPIRRPVSIPAAFAVSKTLLRADPQDVEEFLQTPERRLRINGSRLCSPASVRDPIAMPAHLIHFLDKPGVASLEDFKYPIRAAVLDLLNGVVHRPPGSSFSGPRPDDEGPGEHRRDRQGLQRHLGRPAGDPRPQPSLGA